MSNYVNQVSRVSGAPRTTISKINDVVKTDIQTIDDIGNNFIQDTLPLHIGYSVRQLTTDAVNCMDVRNKDGIVRTFGFVDGYLDVAGVQQHCGTGYGNVVKFYDQSPNQWHLEATIWQNGPVIVDLNGNLVIRNGKAALKFEQNSTEVAIFNPPCLQVESQGTSGGNIGAGPYIESIQSEWGLTMFVGSTHADSTNYQIIASQWQGNVPSDGIGQSSSQYNLQMFSITGNKFRSLFGMFDNPDYDFSSVQSANNITSYTDYIVVTSMDTDAGNANSSVTMAVNSISPQYTGTTPSGSYQITQDDTYPFYLGKGLSQGSFVYYKGYLNEFIVYSDDSHQQIIPSQVSAALTQEANEFYGVF